VAARNARIEIARGRAKPRARARVRTAQKCGVSALGRREYTSRLSGRRGPIKMRGPTLALAISARFAALHESLCSTNQPTSAVQRTPPQDGLTRDLPTEDRSKEAGRHGCLILSHRSRHRVQLRKAEFELNGMFRDAEKRMPNYQRRLVGIHRYRAGHANALHMAARVTRQSGHLANDSPVHRENRRTDRE
jgi:hypothetical protein